MTTTTDRDHEKAWLIENAASLVQTPAYWIGGNAWSSDHRLAIRFCREIDAEKAAQGLKRQFQLATDHRVAEHIFNAGAPTALLNAKQQ